MAANVSTMALNRSVYSAASHGQIVANIESNGGSSRESRDWTNVQVEDMVYHSEGEEEAYRQGFHYHVDDLAGGSSSEGFRHPLAGQGAPTVVVGRRLFEGEAEQSPQSQFQAPPFDQAMTGGRGKFHRQRHSMWVGEQGSHGGSGSNNQSSDFRRYSDTRLVIEPELDYRPHIFNVATAMDPQSVADAEDLDITFVLELWTVKRGLTAIFFPARTFSSRPWSTIRFWTPWSGTSRNCSSWTSGRMREWWPRHRSRATAGKARRSAGVNCR